MLIKEKKNPEIYPLILTGILISVYQFLFNRSLWHDELFIALNIINKTSLDLLQPLDFSQVAPVLFLQFEKLFTACITKSEYGLRFFPLLCYLISLYFLKRIFTFTFSNIAVILFGIALFAFNSTVVYYATEVKQYMTDVMVTTSFYFLLLRNYKSEINRTLILIIGGVFAIFLSNIAVIVLFTSGLYLIYESIEKRKTDHNSLASIFSIWIITFSFYYLNFIKGHPATKIMTDYWEKFFLPANPMKVEFYQFVADSFKMIFTYLFNFGIAGKILLPILYLAGLSGLIIKKNIRILILTVTPITLHFFLSALGQYPFALRLILHTIPGIIIVLSFGFHYSVTFVYDNFNFIRLRTFAYLFPVIFLAIFISQGFPIRREELKETIQYMKVKMRDTDEIYPHGSALLGLKYYSQLNQIPQPFNLIDSCLNKGEENFTHFRNTNERKWILFTRIGDQYKTAMLEKIELLGYRRTDEFETIGSSTYLFER